jgi:hypothetical protein
VLSAKKIFMPGRRCPGAQLKRLQPAFCSEGETRLRLAHSARDNLRSPQCADRRPEEHPAAHQVRYSLILGGNQTTRLTMIGAVHAFRQNPAQWRVLKEGQVTLESACDEALRWTTPAMHFGRIALTSAELSDQSIAPGTWLPYGFLLATVMRRHSPSLTGSI